MTCQKKLSIRHNCQNACRNNLLVLYLCSIESRLRKLSTLLGKEASMEAAAKGVGCMHLMDRKKAISSGGNMHKDIRALTECIRGFNLFLKKTLAKHGVRSS